VPLMGPPPPELESRFKRIKVCLYGMMGSILGQLVAGMLLGSFLRVLVNLSNMLINAIFGIWLLKDDPGIGRVYESLATTCCSMCAEQCPGGMGCLVPFGLTCLVSVVFDTLLNNAIGMIIASVRLIFDPETWDNTLLGTLTSLYLISTIAAYVSQLGAVIFTWLAYRAARDMAPNGMTGGDWQDSGGMGGGQVYRQGTQDAREVRPSAPPAPAAFQAFSGSGRTLGSN